MAKMKKIAKAAALRIGLKSSMQLLLSLFG